MSSESGTSENGKRKVVAQIGERFLDSFTERFSGEKQEQRGRVILFFTTVFLLTLLIIPGQQISSVRYKPGDIAISDIRATQDYLVEDRILTAKKRSEAEVAAPFVYSYSTSAALDLVQRFERALKVVREARAGETFNPDTVRQEISRTLGCEATPAEVAALGRIRNERPLLTETGRIVSRIYSSKIISDHEAFIRDRAHGIVVTEPDTGREIAAGDYSSPLELREARENLIRSRFSLPGDQKDLPRIKELVAKTLTPNLVPDRTATDEKKRAARDSVRPVLYQIKQGEMIVRVGERITEEQAFKLSKIFEARHGANLFITGFGIAGLVLVLFYFPYRFARKNIRKFNPTIKDLFLLSIITIGLFLVFRLAQAVSTAMGGLFPTIDTASYYHLFPFAVGPILVRIILNSEVALVYGAVCAPLIGIMFNDSLPVLIYSLLGGVVGAHGVRHCKDRSTIFTAGLKVSVVNVALTLSFQLVSDTFLTMQTLYSAAFAFAGGIGVAIIVSGTIPLIENLFHYTTDIKLLELSNLNSPILRELMIRAPGTYHHSVLVGNLVEAAAEAINANPLLARVAAYYHDIGKVSKPLYFIENVANGDNRHDRLSPNMSALILISHVKEGVELAREYHLGRPIVDIIRQSHGTGLITYFFEKAKKMAPEGTVVDERDFRYPGPKPQTREAGLVLLADHVEAASRTLADPTPARIQGLVQKIISGIFTDGQLDECELTLKNLHEIAKSFNRILAAIHHQRIDYPEPAYKERSTGGKKSGEDIDSEQAASPSGRDEKPKKSSGEDIKRLGISR